MKKAIMIWVCIFCFSIPIDAQANLEINEKDVEGINQLMIISHPDDETIWGGGHLLSDKYFVVCITNGNNEVRKKEFEKVLKKTKNKGIILNYPDKINGKKDTWDSVRKDIKKDIKKIINVKKWNKIITHNPKGEYGHLHHKMTSKMVSATCVKEKITKKLYYFGKYYQKNNIHSISKKGQLSPKLEKKKKEILSIYASQGKVKKMFEQMFPYENFVSYTKWEK